MIESRKALLLLKRGPKNQFLVPEYARESREDETFMSEKIFIAISEELVGLLLQQYLAGPRNINIFYSIVEEAQHRYALVPIQRTINLRKILRSKTLFGATLPNGNPISTDSQHKIDILLVEENIGIPVEVKAGQNEDILKIERRMRKRPFGLNIQKANDLTGCMPSIFSHYSRHLDPQIQLFSGAVPLDRQWYACLRTRPLHQIRTTADLSCFMNCAFFFMNDLFLASGMNAIEQAINTIVGNNVGHLEIED